LKQNSIIDSGEGIPASDKQASFGRFPQFNIENRAATGGTGLGLSIVKAIEKNQGGKIRFESQEGLGVTFHVDLPIVVDGAVETASKSGSDL